MATKERLTLAGFLDRHAVTMKATRAGKNPNMQDSAEMDHWRCVLTCGNDRMTLVFSKGYGHHGAEPTVGEVLDCLASDSASYDNASSFEDWASEFGFDTDSRKAERSYKATEKQRDDLYRLLGPSAYAALLWQTERE